jgi:hypothetical protein
MKGIFQCHAPPALLPEKEQPVLIQWKPGLNPITTLSPGLIVMLTVYFLLLDDNKSMIKIIPKI